MKSATLLALMLAGCSTGEIVTPAPYAVPISQHCNPPIVAEPQWNVDSLHPPVGVFDGVQAVVADIPIRQAYEAELRAAADACRGPINVNQPGN